MRIPLLLLLLMLASLPLAAQDTPAVSADNVRRLAPAMQLDFAAAPPEAGRIQSGGFVMTGDGSLLAVHSLENTVSIWDDGGNLVDAFSITGEDGLPDTVLDTVFSADGALLAAIASDGATYTIAARLINQRATLLVPFPFAPDVPVRLWFEPELPLLWLEITPTAPGEKSYIAQLPLPLPGKIVSFDDLLTLPSAPEHDPDAFARIGRIPPPRAVTSTQDGLVKLWNLQSGEVTASAQVDALPVFGGINARATHFAWRDPDYTALHLLDFTTGEDRAIAPLDGDYIAYILVSPDADVILGVHVGEQPVVVAWDSASGERIQLGEYRQCSRTPDMARLSRDGTTLVIGCDTGLDLWRIQRPSGG